MSSSEHDIDWAEMVDILAKEYGWTIEYIKSLDLGQITLLLRAIKNRYKKQNDEDTDFNEDSGKNKELSIEDFKAMGTENIREDGRTEIRI